jgi:hypothetical protein
MKKIKMKAVLSTLYLPVLLAQQSWSVVNVQPSVSQTMASADL